MTETTAQARDPFSWIDRLAWGLGDMRMRLATRGWWPTVRTVAIDENGTCWGIRGTGAAALNRPQKARAVAVVPERVLSGRLTLPPMRRRELISAVQEALHTRFPLPPERMVYGWHETPSPHGGWQVQWAAAVRDHVAATRRVQRVSERAPVFLLKAGGSVIPVRDEAHARRMRYLRLWDVLGGLALGLPLAAASLLALMPAVLEREGVVAAMRELTSLENRAAPVRQQLEALRVAARLNEQIGIAAAQQTTAAAVVETLSAALPDDTMLDRLDIQGQEIRISGLTPNAANLLSALAGSAAFADVKAPSAAVRDPATNKERFTFELRWKGGGA